MNDMMPPSLRVQLLGMLELDDQLDDWAIPDVSRRHAQPFADRPGWREEWRVDLAPRHVPANEDFTGGYHRGEDR